MTFLLFTSALAAFIGMEFWAAFVHRILYHGVFWSIHRTHHRPRRGPFEMNDIFVLAHALAAMAIVVAGVYFAVPLLTAIGIGISLYGLLYALLHDGYVHARLPLQWLDRWSMFRALKEAHLYHHTGDPDAHFGLLFWNREPYRRDTHNAEQR